MSAIPPQVDPSVLQHAAQLAEARGWSVNDLLASAIAIFEDAEQRHAELRQEIQSRIAQSGTSASQPLDLEEFKREARSRYGKAD
jgi:hypothetical protein